MKKEKKKMIVVMVMMMTTTMMMTMMIMWWWRWWLCDDDDDDTDPWDWMGFKFLRRQALLPESLASKTPVSVSLGMAQIIYIYASKLYSDIRESTYFWESNHAYAIHRCFTYAKAIHASRSMSRGFCENNLTLHKSNRHIHYYHYQSLLQHHTTSISRFISSIFWSTFLPC